MDQTNRAKGNNLEWLFSFMILFSGSYLLFKPATNTKVLIFRVVIVLTGVIGLIVTTIIKRRRR